MFEWFKTKRVERAEDYSREYYTFAPQEDVTAKEIAHILSILFSRMDISFDLSLEVKTDPIFQRHFEVAKKLDRGTHIISRV